MLKSLRTRILLGFLLVIFLLGILGSWAIITLSGISKNTGTVFRDKLTLVQSLGTLDTSVVELRASSTRLIFYPDETRTVNRFNGSVVSANRALLELASYSKGQPTDTALVASIEEIRQLTNFLTHELESQLGLLRQGARGGMSVKERQVKARETAEIFTSELDPEFDTLKGRIGGIEQGYIVQLGNISSQGLQRAERIRTEVFSLGFFVLILCLVFSVRFAGVIVTPIAELTEKTRRISAGELNQIVIPRTNDEIGRLAEQFNAMAEKLGEFEELNLKKILEEKAISESIVQSMDDGLFLIDRFGVILSINLKAQQMFALTNVEGKHCLDVSRGIQALESLCIAALLGSWREADSQTLVEHITGTGPIILRREITPIRSGEDPGTVAFLLIFRDVTREHQLERMRSDFVGMVSHELRTPLTAIRMSVDLLAEPDLGVMNPVQEQFVQAIREESERLLRIVNDLMDLARLEGGKFKVRPVDLDLNQFIEHLLVPFAANAQELGVELRVEADPAITTVRADPDRLKQVFVNLVGNGLRYTHRGGSITLGLRLAEEAEMAEFFVRDTGSGIPPEFLSKIFERFAIISKDVKSGTGLGLAIAREIVQAHGGSMRVKSEVGVGTEFSFTIPIAGTTHSRITQAKEGKNE